MIVSSTLTPDIVSYFSLKDGGECIGMGGQKQVFKVFWKGKDTALKLFHNCGSGREVTELLLQKKYADVGGVPKILHHEQIGDNLFLFEEYIDGESLDKIHSRFNHNMEKTIFIISEIFRILRSFRADGNIHRDIKPGNIMIDKNGNIFVLDFGIAKILDATTITATGMQPKSIPFVSPEQILDKKGRLCERTDFFCIGVLSYFLYYGKFPFGNTSESLSKYYMEPGYKISEIVENDGSGLYKFLTNTLKYHPSERISDIDILLSFLN